MDRKSKLKINILFVVFSAFAFGILLFILTQMSSDVSESQINEMVAIHPELKREIIGTFEYYDQKREMLIWCMGGILFVLSIFSLVFLSLHKRRERKMRLKAEQTNLLMLHEQLEAFQKGKYEIAETLFDQGAYHQPMWNQVDGSLRELGYFFQELKEQLEKEENSTKTLITDISHQLKTPLASLKMSFELSQEKALSEAEKAEFILKEKQEILKLESLLEELVKLSRLESHMIQVNQKIIGIQDLITEAMNQVLMKAYVKNITLQADIQDNYQIRADVKWTVEALVNVLDNAIKYSGDEKQVLVQVRKLPNLILLEIEDEGIGIPAEELHKVFQRFYRGKEASNQVKEGAGVGLYLSRKIIEEQGGTITAKRKQVGTIFRITLPL